MCSSDSSVRYSLTHRYSNSAGVLKLKAGGKINHTKNQLKVMLIRQKMKYQHCALQCLRQHTIKENTQV